jgi:plastocyanin
VDVTAAAAGVSQPMHIHTGPCAQLGGVVYPLTNVSSGASTTTVDAKLDDLLNGNFAINVHKSTTESSVYTACGDLPKGSVVKVDAKNNSGQDGWVALSDSGGNTLVVIDVKPGAAGVAQPAHVHNGPCDRLGGVVHPLTNVSNGRSVSLIAAKVDALQTGTFAVNVHKSPQEASVYTACGDIPRVATFTLKGLGDAATAQPGQATLIGMGTSTRVIVQVKAGPRGTEQPIHIHNGPCDRLGGVVHSLTNVVNGRSTTDVAAPIATLLNGTFAINLHKSGAEASVYVACGDLTGAAPSGTPAATPSGTGSPAGASQQTIQNFRLPSFSVAAGSAVTWTNMDNDGHSVTSGTPPTKDGKFDSGEMRQNDKFSFTFTQPGEYPYFCVYHTSMTGKVTVTAGSSATGTVSPTSTRSASADPYEY